MSVNVKLAAHVRRCMEDSTFIFYCGDEPEDKPFRYWLSQVDFIIDRAIDCGVFDIADRCWRDAFDQDSTPLEAVEDLIGDPTDFDSFGHAAVFD